MTAAHQHYAQAQLEIARRELERRRRAHIADTTFTDWLPQVSPAFTWDWRHLVYIRSFLDQVTSGAIKKLMIFVPPRHGKSEMATIRYPVYRMEQHPKLRVIVGCYNTELATTFSREARRIAASRALTARSGLKNTEALKPLRWGEGVEAKENAPALLADYLARASVVQRRQLRIFMATATDPYMPLEKQRGITRALLEVFARYDDLDLLVIQTRSPLVARDFDLLKHIPYAWLSLSIESDDEAQLLRGGPSFVHRLATAARAVQAGVRTQIAVAPCLPHSPDFAAKLLETGAQRFVIDTLVAGDGQGGSRSARSPYALLMPDWPDEEPAHQLAEDLEAGGVEVGWSAQGFGSIPYRTEDARKGHPGGAAQAGDDMQLSLFPSEPPPEGAIVLTLGDIEQPRRPLAGFPYFWLKYVSGFDARFHCAQCLVGPYHKGIWSTVRVPSVHILTQAQGWRYAYLCGVADTHWADNLHVPVEPAPGEEVEAYTFNGVRVHLTNARRLAIPWIEDGWQGFPRSYTTCRNFQFGVAQFGYDGTTRPSQAEFTNPRNGRSLAALQRRERRRRSP